MIAIQRPSRPAFLSGPDNKWDRETAQAIAFYSSPNPQGNFEFKAYNDPLLKEALKQVFVKCAYCESKYDQSSDGDIEHFRPKGRVQEKTPQTPGYYWLANNWDNLLLSCQHCNQRRTHLLVGDTQAAAYGKVDQFPMNAPVLHSKSHLDLLSDEEPGRLLLNPYVPADDPESHFSYEQNTAAMLSTTIKGQTSIRVYALLRPNLVAARNERRIFLFKQMVVVSRQLDVFNLNPTLKNKEVFNEELENLLFYASPGQPYAGMCRYFIRKFFAENNIQP